MKKSTFLIFFLLLRIDNVLAQGAMPRFREYKENYFLFTSVSHWSETKFQFSVQYKIIDSVEFYFGYTQKSFWNAWDFALSSPFKESNYNPELFYRYRFRLSEENYLQGGLEHESNGRDGPDSRSWNRGYVLANRAITPFFGVRGKLWIPFAIAKENQTIQDNLGYGEIEFRFSESSRPSFFILTADVRKGANSEARNGGIQVGLVVRPIGFVGASLYLQYYNGMGENLLEFNIPVKRFRMGIILLD
jgi:phospholipase A1